jgi:hypothetical protein
MSEAKGFEPLPYDPRWDLCEKARRELDAFTHEWSLRHDLTFAEQFSLLSNSISVLASRCVAIERRKLDSPNPSTEPVK